MQFISLHPNSRDVGRYLKLSGHLVTRRGHTSDPQVNLLKPRWAIDHPAQPSPTSLNRLTKCSVEPGEVQLTRISTDYGHPERNQPSLHGRKFNHNPKVLGTAEAYFVCHIGPIFQMSLINAFTGCPQSVRISIV